MLEVMMPGYFTESQCKAIKEKLEGKTFYIMDQQELLKFFHKK